MNKDEVKIGDRVRYWWSEQIQWGKSVLEVVRLEERGAVCDLLQLREDKSWRNVGHRMLYEYEKLQKI